MPSTSRRRKEICKNPMKTLPWNKINIKNLLDGREMKYWLFVFHDRFREIRGEMCVCSQGFPFTNRFSKINPSVSWGLLSRFFSAAVASAVKNFTTLYWNLICARFRKMRCDGMGSQGKRPDPIQSPTCQIGVTQRIT